MSLLSVIMSQMKQMSFKPRLKTVSEVLSRTVLGSEFQTAGAE